MGISNNLVDGNLDGFAREVLEGLSRKTKFLSSKYFYNEKGDALFRRIMTLPEYYLTKCEAEIFTTHGKEIARTFAFDKPFDIVELGAGDGTKTIELLRLVEDEILTYRPIDISTDAINTVTKNVASVLPSLRVEGLKGEYFEVLERIKSDSTPKVVFFLGSNIGNLTIQEARHFMEQLSTALNKRDKVLLGVDLKKSERIVLPAYNDSQGVTKAFNLNLLERINEELGGNFKLDKFLHEPVYDEESGLATSYLTSTEEQEVRIKKIDCSFFFLEGERIHTEISQKYDEALIKTILKNSSFMITEKYMDSKAYYANYLLTKL